MYTETGITQHNQEKNTKGSKGEATIFEDAGRLKINLPRQYFGGKQIKKALGLKASKENWAIAERIAKRVTFDLQEGDFDESLVRYGVKSNLKLVNSDDLPPKPKLGILDLWDLYLEFKKPTLRKSTYTDKFKGVFRRAIQQAVVAVGENPISIRTWLLTNRCLLVAKEALSHLSHAHVIAIRQGLINSNPFDGMAEELKVNKNTKVNLHDSESEKDLYSPEHLKKKAFTVDEINHILEYVAKSQAKHYYPIIRFLFLTGCRTSEAIALMWGDIKWDKEYIVFQRSYDLNNKEFCPTKTGLIRLFPMPRNSELWNLLKSLDTGKPNEVIFKSKEGNVISRVHLSNLWKGAKCDKIPGFVTTLVTQGKVTKYLPLYNTRHTFISYQINECGISPHVVKDWCGHSENMTTKVYREEDFVTKPSDYQTSHTQKTESKSDILSLQQQNEQLQAQLKALQESVASMQSQLNS